MPADNKKLQEKLIEEFGKRYLDRVELPQYLYTSLSRKLRPYQDECFRYFTTFISESYDGKPRQPHLLFHMATGSGKKLVMARSILYLNKMIY